MKLSGKIDQTKIGTGHKSIPKGKVFKSKKKYDRKQNEKPENHF